MALRQRYVIEIQCADDGHPVIRRQDYFGGQSSDRSGCRYDV
jgi:hypothetical protein